MDLNEYISSNLQAFKNDVKSELERIGTNAVEIAKSSTSYHDITGNLRRSNKFEATGETLRIYNTAPYAAAVEARTGDVIANAVLYAKQELEK